MDSEVLTEQEYYRARIERMKEEAEAFDAAYSAHKRMHELNSAILHAQVQAEICRMWSEAFSAPTQEKQS